MTAGIALPAALSSRVHHSAYDLFDLVAAASWVSIVVLNMTPSSASVSIRLRLFSFTSARLGVHIVEDWR